jgi:DNA-binding response OmpR family regulator
MRKCILIYEDDPELSEICQVLLAQPDRHIEVKDRCDHIISDIEQFKPGVILMDLWIPEMGGKNATVLIKDNPDTKDIPVILFSANPEIDKISTEVNADGYITKPFDIAFFRETVEKNIL